MICQDFLIKYFGSVSLPEAGERGLLDHIDKHANRLSDDYSGGEWEPIENGGVAYFIPTCSVVYHCADKSYSFNCFGMLCTILACADMIQEAERFGDLDGFEPMVESMEYLQSKIG